MKLKNIVMQIVLGDMYAKTTLDIFSTKFVMKRDFKNNQLALQFYFNPMSPNLHNCAKY